MPSLGIAPHSGSCLGRAGIPKQSAAPVSGVFPTDGILCLLEIRLQAIQLSPCRAGPSTRCSYAWTQPLIFCHAVFPLSFRSQVRHRTQKHPCKFLPTTPGIQRSASWRSGPYPPGWSRFVAYGTSTLVSLLHLLVSLAGPAPSGNTGTSRRCQGRSRPPAPPRSNCPQLQPSCCNNQAAESSHPRSDTPRLAAHRLIHKPAITCCVPTGSRRVDQQGCEPLPPSAERVKTGQLTGRRCRIRV
jgi:hypothetical protein